MQWPDFHKQIRHFPPAEQERIRRAFELGMRLHDGQKRRSGEPYFTHPIVVAEMLIPMGADADTIIAALLHDAAEDTPSSPEEIGRPFNGDVVALIDGLTKLCAEDFSEKPRLNEQVETVRKMFALMEKDVRIMVIKLADRLHNMRTIRFLAPERQITLARETMDVYVKIADRLCMQDLRHEMEGLCLALLEPDLRHQFEALLRENERKSARTIPAMQEKLEASHAALLKHIKVLSEPKRWERLRAQWEAQGTAVTGLTTVNIIFVCASREACYRMLGAVHELWRREETSFRDSISSPLANGYQGIHTTVILDDGTRVRCKIRTREMQEYSHKGVTTFCFRPDTRENLASYLPWTRHIGPLAEDTKDRSSDFWESLQDEILGDTVTIHGPGDEAVEISKEATALDGAFVLFQENALRLQSLKINGKDVPLTSTLTDGVTLFPTFSEDITASREWLDWVKTRFAGAMIRGALAERSQEEKARIGKEMLQKVIGEHQRGYLEEFHHDTLEEGARSLGYDTLEEAYVAIAEGRVAPRDVYDAIFVPSSRKREARLNTIRYNMNLRDTDLMDRLISVHRKYSDQVKDIRYKQDDPEHGIAQLKARLTFTEQRAIVTDLAAAGAANITVTLDGSAFRLLSGLMLVLFLWGLDPVVARFLIGYDRLTAVDFTLLRFWSLAIIFLGIAAYRRRRNILQPLRLYNPLLWLSSILLAIVALTTYAALQGGTATQYEIIMTASGLLVATAFRSISRAMGFLLWMLFAAAILLLTQSSGWNLGSGIVMALALVCFASFLAVSTRYLQQEFVARRRLEYYTAMLVIGSLCILPLFFFASPAIRDPLTILHTTLFSIIFIGLPYYLYYEFSPKEETGSVIPFAFVMLGTTFLGELALTRRGDIFTLLPFVMMILLSFLLERRRRV